MGVKRVFMFVSLCRDVTYIKRYRHTCTCVCLCARVLQNLTCKLHKVFLNCVMLIYYCDCGSVPFDDNAIYVSYFRFCGHCLIQRRMTTMITPCLLITDLSIEAYRRRGMAYMISLSDSSEALGYQTRYDTLFALWKTYKSKIF